MLASLCLFDVAWLRLCLIGGFLERASNSIPQGEELTIVDGEEKVVLSVMGCPIDKRP